jgi:hypothetical protein
MKLICSLCLLLSLGCGSAVDDRADLDTQIEEQWLVGREMVDAVEFFEQGGVFEDTDDPDIPEIDQVTILPLLRKIHDTLGVTATVVVDEPGFAFALLVPVPENDATQARIRELLREADKDFFGVIMHNWSHHWIPWIFWGNWKWKHCPKQVCWSKFRK